MAKKANKASGVKFNEYDKDQRKVLLKNKKRKRLKKRVKIVLVVVIIALVIAFFVNPISKIKSFTFYGNHQIKTTALEQASAPYKKSYFFAFSKKQYQEELKSMPLVNKARVSANVFGYVSVDIQEASIVAYGAIGKQTYILDDAKHVFALNDDYHIASLQKYPKLQKFKSVEMMQAFLKEYLKLPDIIRSSVSDILYDPTKTEDKQVRFIMDNGKAIVVRYDEMADELSVKKFNYQAYVAAYSDYCTFTIRNDRVVYMTKCK